MAATASQAPHRTLFDLGWNAAMTGSFFASNVTYYRVAAGMSMTDLARRSGVTQPNIGRYERGETLNPSNDIIQKLCAALGVTYDQLMTQPPPEVLPPGTTPQARRVEPSTDPASDDRLDRLEQQVADLAKRPPMQRLFPRDGRILRFLQQAAASPEGGESWLAQEASTERYVVQAIGNCLEPHVYENDLLVLDVDRREPKIGEIVAVAVHGELHLKMVMDRTGVGLYLTSTRGELSLPEDGVELLGVIIDITRRVPPMATSMGNPGHGGLKKPRLVAPPLPEPWSATGEDGD